MSKNRARSGKTPQPITYGVKVSPVDDLIVYPERAHSLGRVIALQTNEVWDCSPCPVFMNGFLCGYVNDQEAFTYSYKESKRFRSQPPTPAWVRGWHQGQRMAGHE